MTTDTEGWSKRTLLRETFRLLEILNAWSINMAETMDTLTAKVADLESKVDENTAKDNVLIGLAQDQKTMIADLKAQLAAGTPVSQAQLDALGAGIDRINAKVSASNAAEGDATTQVAG